MLIIRNDFYILLSLRIATQFVICGVTDQVCRLDVEITVKLRFYTLEFCFLALDKHILFIGEFQQPVVILLISGDSVFWGYLRPLFPVKSV